VTSISGWVSTAQDPARWVVSNALLDWGKADSAYADALCRAAANDIARRSRGENRTIVWQRAAQEKLIREIAELEDGWDGHSGTAINQRVIYNARFLLGVFTARALGPDFILPSTSGTVTFEWERDGGSAVLEIGKSTYGFYTTPASGKAILIDGLFEAFDGEQLWKAVASISEKSVPQSVADFDLAAGF
jgi:hypothetical protein